VSGRTSVLTPQKFPARPGRCTAGELPGRSPQPLRRGGGRGRRDPRCRRPRHDRPRRPRPRPPRAHDRPPRREAPNI